ncbi:hypothetical protein FRC07_005079 [Ceratobasidium sp. 392]|nr:hypothetical protein FRC07_005079 [Ceratobasidium sp. 392]
MFKVANGDPHEGASPENPIILEGVAASDFECLLEVLYESHSANQSELILSHVMPAFRLAHKWNFRELRARLLPLVQNLLSLVDQIVLARDYDMNEWLVLAYIRLCQQTSDLTTDEAAKLGVHGVLLIYRLKVQYLRPTNYLICPNCLCSGSKYHTSAPCGMCRGHRSDLIMQPKYVGEDEASLRPKIEKWIADGCVFKD